MIRHQITKTQQTVSQPQYGNISVIKMWFCLYLLSTPDTFNGLIIIVIMVTKIDILSSSNELLVLFLYL
jgi:hypothetical protein